MMLLLRRFEDRRGCGDGRGDGHVFRVGRHRQRVRSHGVESEGRVDHSVRHPFARSIGQVSLAWYF